MAVGPCGGVAEVGHIRNAAELSGDRGEAMASEGLDDAAVLVKRL